MQERDWRIGSNLEVNIRQNRPRTRLQAIWATILDLYGTMFAEDGELTALPSSINGQRKSTPRRATKSVACCTIDGEEHRIVTSKLSKTS